MPITSDVLVDDLYKIMTSSIAQARFYKSRATGFRNELEFVKLNQKKKLNIIEGGQFLFSKKNKQESPENSAIYITISDDDKNRYVGFYELISMLEIVEKLFFIEMANTEEWNTVPFTVKNDRGNNEEIQILGPKLTVFKFKSGGEWTVSNFDEIKEFLVQRASRICAKKDPTPFSYLKFYGQNDLAKIYCNRFVLDVVLNLFNKTMMDFDHILVEGKKFTAIETKEKDPIGKKENPSDSKSWAFGWDSRRLAWYILLKQKIDLDAWYVIREVAEQIDRKFLGWKKIDMDKFCRCASWSAERSAGGGGGTVDAPYTAFEDF